MAAINTTTQVENNYDRFIAELTALTRKYGVAIQSVGGVYLADERGEFALWLVLRALAVLRANPSKVGKVNTTCVPTMADAGHALNALPQRATACDCGAACAQRARRV